jgi:hypothetical protein
MVGLKVWGSSTKFIAGLALEPDVGALCAAWANSVATNLFASTSVTGLSDTALCAVADLDHFHRKASPRTVCDLQGQAACPRLPFGAPFGVL